MPNKIEQIIGDTDDRERITNTQDFPWNTHCYLESHFTGDPTHYYVGTGCLVSPYMVLTCAHNIYSLDLASYVSKMIVAPGQKQDYKNGPVQQPYGTCEIADSRVAPGYPGTESGTMTVDDFGAVWLSQPFPGINTYMPLEFGGTLTTGETLRLAGYPGEVKLGTPYEDRNTSALWDASGPLGNLLSSYMFYGVDTSSGDSGTSVRRGDGSTLDPYRIIGIHSGYTPGMSLNGGARLSSYNQALITEWMQWKPEGDKVIFEDTFPLITMDRAKWTVVSGATSDNVGLDEPSSPYSLRLNGYPSGGDSVESRVIDLSPYIFARLTYWFQQTGGGESPDSGDDLIVEYYNGSSWVELDRQLGSGPDMTNFEKRVIDLPPAAMIKTFKLRIRSIGTLDPMYVYDDWFVDNIQITVDSTLPGDLVEVTGASMLR